MRYVVIVAALLLSSGGYGSCGQVIPVPGGDVARTYAPVGRYAGHWGVDLAAPIGTPVRAVLSGTVSFSGTVASVMTVTVDHGRGLRTSYSYLTSRAVRRGDVVAAGVTLGESGVDRSVAALHLSLRLGGQYRDPMRILLCGSALSVRPYLAP
ncbi:putative peptidase [bacterium BMS3Bbin02]|nr:putative peptidase [bacterium BMS3Bbin02]